MSTPGTRRNDANMIIAMAEREAIAAGWRGGEPMAPFASERWKDAAVDFLRRSPDAAGYEIRALAAASAPGRAP